MDLSNHFLFSILFVFTLLSCNTTQKTPDQSDLEYEDGKNYVTTILLEFRNQEEDPIKIYDIITKEGYLKNGHENNVNQRDQYLTVFEYSDNTPKIKRTIPDPINKTVEFVDANGNLGKKDIQLENEVVPLRVNYNKALTTLKIYNRKNSEWKLLMTFNLNQ